MDLEPLKQSPVIVGSLAYIYRFDPVVQEVDAELVGKINCTVTVIWIMLPADGLLPSQQFDARATAAWPPIHLISFPVQAIIGDYLVLLS